MKKVLMVILFASLLVSMIPLPVNALPSITDITDRDLNSIAWGVYGDFVYVHGDGVTSGSEVKLYWDTVKEWDGEAGLLNTTSALPDGTFKVAFLVPVAVNGAHYLWLRDSDTPVHTFGPEPFYMNASLIASPTSGLKDDPITLEGYGFGDEVNVDVIKFNGSPLTTSPSTPSTDVNGSWTATFNVPDKPDGDYNITAEDVAGNSAFVAFKVSPTITTDINDGSVGTIVTVNGRGFTSSGKVTSVTLDGIDCWVIDTNDLDINGAGGFTFEIIIPSVNITNKEYVLEVVDDGNKNATSSFLVTAITTLELTPTFGGPGTIVGIVGYNFAEISDSEVVIKFDGDPVTTLETNSDGDISGVFLVPALSQGNYMVVAEQVSYNIEASKVFRLGTIVVILEPKTGPTGTKVTLTGIGFTADGEWEAFFGDIPIFEEMTVANDTTLFGNFYVPVANVEEYTITVVDLDEDVSVTMGFTVTDNTSLSFDPPSSPVGFNVTIEGMYFAESSNDIDVEFVIYNSTDVLAMEVFEGSSSVTTEEEGEFTAWWMVPDDLSVGSYSVNATDEEGLLYRLVFDVLSKYLSIAPHKSAYQRGDTVRFNIESSFEETGSYIMVYDPDGFIRWVTDDLDTWVEMDVTYIAPLYTQTSGGAPMILDEDAPFGTWSWIWNDSWDEFLASGTFTVEEPPPDNGDGGDNVTDAEIIILQQKVQDLEDLVDQLSIDLQNALLMKVQDLEDLVDQLSIDLQNALLMIEILSSSTTDSIDDLESNLEEVAEDAAESKEDVGEVKGIATEAEVSADDAKDAAEEAKSIARQVKDEVDEARADAQKALNSSSTNKTLVFVAILISVVAIGITLFGPARARAKIEDIMDRTKRIALQNRPPEIKKSWRTAYCSHCNKKIEFNPKAGFEQKKIRLRCPHCGKKVTITPLDDLGAREEK
jgi:DNA-directed RNA polymerase subunit RPC12/RpoP